MPAFVPEGRRGGAVLFDLDGTLLDTAPDMVAALNDLLAELELATVSFATGRPQVSNGASGLLRLRFPDFEPTRHPDLHRRFLELYAARLCRETRLFAGFDRLLGGLDDAGVPWGVVTNKPAFLTEPLLDSLGLLRRSACVVSGDTLPERKPHPRPVLHALERIGAAPDRSWYVGDALRDIQSGRSAGTRTIAAGYGYISPGQDPATWGADHVVDSVAQLAGLVLDAGAPAEMSRPRNLSSEMP
jgi:2-phosphoglycolate phosphatase